jgi:hypothetical protein
MIHPLRVIELENALYNQDKLFCKIFHENKKLNLKLESGSSEIASLRSAHDDMSAKPCDICTMIMVNYADLWLIHSHVVGLLDCVRLELRELKAHSTLLGACTSCLLLRSDLEAAAVEIKDLKHKLDHSSSYTVLSPPCEACVSLNAKIFHATKENIKLQQEVVYLTARLEKTALSEKMTEEDLSQVKERATKSTYRLGIEFERCEKNGEKSALEFICSSSYHKEEEELKPTKAHYSSNLKSSLPFFFLSELSSVSITSFHLFESERFLYSAMVLGFGSLIKFSAMTVEKHRFAIVVLRSYTSPELV